MVILVVMVMPMNAMVMLVMNMVRTISHVFWPSSEMKYAVWERNGLQGDACSIFRSPRWMRTPMSKMMRTQQLLKFLILRQKQYGTGNPRCDYFVAVMFTFVVSPNGCLMLNQSVHDVGLHNIMLWCLVLMRRMVDVSQLSQ